MTISYFPRISDQIASGIIQRMIDSSPEDLSEIASSTHQYETHYSTANERVPPQALEDLRQEILALAFENGFPQKPTGDQARIFDQSAGGILDGNTCDMVPAEAAHRDVWNFITLVLLPDVAKWRYENPARKLDYDRWLGSPRNVFRKLWWREATLGRRLNSQLGEDEAVGIMERPKISGYPGLSRAAANALVVVSAEFSDLPRSEIARKAMVNLRRRVAVVDFSIFPEKILHDMLISIYRESAEAYRAYQIGKSV